jgi:hypothetical protein
MLDVEKLFFAVLLCFCSSFVGVSACLLLLVVVWCCCCYCIVIRGLVRQAVLVWSNMESLSTDKV